MNDEETKRSVKEHLSLGAEYAIWEVLEAILENDSAKLDEMRARLALLKSEYVRVVAELDSKDPDRINIAKSSFKRPNK
jgi:uncharacterized small protein (DUF1192 family)